MRRNTEVTEINKERAPQGAHKKPRPLFMQDAVFDYTYVLDFRKYAPVYDESFKKKFYLGGHLNAAGYRLTAKMTESYIDYIIRHNMEDFAQVAFIGTPFHNCEAKW